VATTCEVVNADFDVMRTCTCRTYTPPKGVEVHATRR
jgi:hypothetical protein